ncbi:MAG: methyl-accepting chemotaxis protein [Magnetococcales bacterium]|nr:methyl-accepting chemotaxis protein [Magnetococcales bacterium]
MIRLQDIRLRPKLTVLLLLCGLIPVSMLWWLRDHQADRSQIIQATARLEAARQIALADIKRHLAERRADMEILAQIAAEHHQQARAALESLRDLKKERIETFLSTQLTDLVQLAANPDFVKRVAAIDWLFRQGGRKSDDKHWRETVEGFVPPVHGRQHGSAWEDLYFVSPQGDVVYTLNRQNELGQNLLQKPWKESPLALAHRHGLEAAIIQDFQSSTTPELSNILFLAAPVKKDGAVIGTVITRISRNILTQLLRAGLDPASSGDLMLAAADGLRSDPRTPPAALPTSAIQAALEGKSGSALLSETGRPPLLAAWAPLRVKGLRWAVVAEKDAARLFAPHSGEKQNWLQKFSETAGYYDLFLVHPNGEVFHTSARQADFATNLVTGRYASTNLGQLIQKVLKTKEAGLSDLLPYPPSDNQPAFFMAQPVIDNGQLVLVAALQLAPDALTNLLHPLAQSSPQRIFLVGPDERLRSDAFTDPASPATATAFIGTPAATVAAPRAIQSALAGENATLETTHADGKRVLASFAPLPLDGFTWAVIAETDLDDPATPAANTLPMLVAMLACVALLTGGAALVIHHDLLKPLRETAFTLNRMAAGHFTPQETITRRDEIGMLTRSVSTVSSEVAQAGHRIQQAADPVALRIRRLASHAMAISRESAAGAELLTEARKAIEENTRLVAEESMRLIQEQNRLVAAQTRLLHDGERMAGRTAQAVAEGQQVIHDTKATWHHLLERLQHLQEQAQELNTIQHGHKSSDDNGKGSGKSGKHGHHGKEPARTTREMQTELAELSALIRERLTTADAASNTLDALLPAMPMLQHPEANHPVALEHSPERTLLALEKLDDLLRKNVATAREIILAAKAVFDLTTGPLKQAASYFAPHHPVLSEPLPAHLAPDPMHPATSARVGSASPPSAHDEETHG